MEQRTCSSLSAAPCRRTTPTSSRGKVSQRCSAPAPRRARSSTFSRAQSRRSTRTGAPGEESSSGRGTWTSMRFRLVCAGVLAAGLATAAPAGATTNPQHAGLQVALRAQGLYLGPIDAIVGPRTLAAVRAFQRSHGLPVTGIADVRTRRQLGPLGTPLFGSRPLQRGRFGWDVAVLQYLLNKHGVRVPVNAYMDKPTVSGLRRYQRLLHLPMDGIVGPATFAALGLQTRVPVRTALAVSSFRRYVVKPGDSLTAIAR